MNIFIDPRFEALYRDRPIVLVDVGARGGVKHNWSPARRHLRVIGFEPDPREFRALSGRLATADPPVTLFETALHNRPGPIRFHIARDRGLSSLFEPDRAFLNEFPESDRFDLVDTREVQADTLDNVLRQGGVEGADFIKSDTQGSELLVLQGAARTLERSVLGVETEVEFSPIYKDQPLFADVDAFLRGRGYSLFDLRPVYWKRAAGRDIGDPRGQLIWADALYFRSIPALEALLASLETEERRAKALKAISLTLLYGYVDYALQIATASAGAFDAAERAAIERGVRAAGRLPAGVRTLPGSRGIAAVFHRLWRAWQPRDTHAWSISAPRLGNRG